MTNQIFSPSKDNGFSLLQVLISIAILASMSVMMWAALQQTSNAKRKGEASMDLYQSGRNATERLSKDISMAYLSSHQFPQDNQNPRTFFEGQSRGGADSLAFSYFGHRRLYEEAAESDTAVVFYQLQPDPNRANTFLLVRKETKRIQSIQPDALSTLPGSTEIVCDRVVRFELLYFDANAIKSSWVSSWSTTKADGFPNRLPTRVMIKLVLKNEQDHEIPFVSETRVALHQAVDNTPK